MLQKVLYFPTQQACNKMALHCDTSTSLQDIRNITRKTSTLTLMLPFNTKIQIPQILFNRYLQVIGVHLNDIYSNFRAPHFCCVKYHQRKKRGVYIWKCFMYFVLYRSFSNILPFFNIELSASYRIGEMYLVQVFRIHPIPSQPYIHSA